MLWNRQQIRQANDFHKKQLATILFVFCCCFFGRGTAPYSICFNWFLLPVTPIYITCDDSHTSGNLLCFSDVNSINIGVPHLGEHHVAEQISGFRKLVADVFRLPRRLQIAVVITALFTKTLTKRQRRVLSVFESSC